MHPPVSAPATRESAPAPDQSCPCRARMEARRAVIVIRSCWSSMRSIQPLAATKSLRLSAICGQCEKGFCPAAPAGLVLCGWRKLQEATKGLVCALQLVVLHLQQPKGQPCGRVGGTFDGHQLKLFEGVSKALGVQQAHVHKPSGFPALDFFQGTCARWARPAAGRAPSFRVPAVQRPSSGDQLPVPDGRRREHLPGRLRASSCAPKQSTLLQPVSGRIRCSARAFSTTRAASFLSEARENPRGIAEIAVERSFIGKAASSAARRSPVSPMRFKAIRICSVICRASRDDGWA